MQHDYINLVLLLLTYGISAMVLIGISVLIVNRLSFRAAKIRNENQINLITTQSKHQKAI